MSRLLYFLRQALGCIRQSPWSTVVAAATVAIALAATVGAYLAAKAAEAGLRSYAADARLTIWLRAGAVDGADELSGQLLADKAREAAREVAGEGVRVDYVSPTTALARLRADLGDSGRALDTLAYNPLPPSLEVRFPGGGGALGEDLAEVKELAAKLAGLPFAGEVEYGRAFVDRLQTLLLGVRAAGLGVFALVLGLALFVTGVVVRLTIYARREEIEILRLVGATDAFIATPFVIEGALQGLLGGLGAVVLAQLIESQVLPLLLSTFGFGGELAPATLPESSAMWLAVAGLVVGIASSGIAVARWLAKSV